MLKVEASQSIQDLNKRLKTFLEKSDLYYAPHILDLLPQDYLYQQRCILLARTRKYKEAFDLAIGELGDLAFADRLASIATIWQPETKKIYTQMHGALQRAGHASEAKQLLNKHFKSIDFVEVTRSIEDEEMMDESLFEIF